jgi:outer membrane protein TolC
VLALLAACAAGPDYRAPATTSLGVPGHYATPADASEPERLADWWTRFGDEELTGLVEAAMAANLDIAQAAARLRVALDSLLQ